MAPVRTILQRVADGDAQAVTECLDEYGGLVWRLALRHLRSRADAEDATQEVFVSIWVSAARFDPEKGSEPAFIATIAHRRLIDYRRSLMTRRMVSTEVVAPPAADPQGGGDPPGWDGARPGATRALDDLPNDERQAIRMSIGSGMTHTEIADALEIPVGTVKTRLRRALRRMRELATGSPEKAGKGSA